MTMLDPDIPAQDPPDFWKYFGTVDQIEKRIILSENVGDVDRDLIRPRVLRREAIDCCARALDGCGRERVGHDQVALALEEVLSFRTSQDEVLHVSSLE